MRRRRGRKSRRYSCTRKGGPTKDSTRGPRGPKKALYNLSLVLNVVGCYHALHLVTERAKELVWNNLRSLEVAIDGVVEEHVDLPLEVLLVLGKSLFVVNL